MSPIKQDNIENLLLAINEMVIAFRENQKVQVELVAAFKKSSDTQTDMALLSHSVTTLAATMNRVENTMNKIAEDHEERIRDTENTVSGLSGSFKTWQIIQGLYATVVGAIVSLIKPR